MYIKYMSNCTDNYSMDFTETSYIVLQGSKVHVLYKHGYMEGIAMWKDTICHPLTLGVGTFQWVEGKCGLYLIFLSQGRI